MVMITDNKALSKRKAIESLFKKNCFSLRIILLILSAWITQAFSLFLQFRIRISTARLLPVGVPAELGIEQRTIGFFIIALIFLVITILHCQKRWFVLSILNSLIVVCPSFFPFYLPSEGFFD